MRTSYNIGFMKPKGFQSSPYSATNEGGDGYWDTQLCQNPNNTSLIKTIVWNGRNIQIRTSTDKGKTWNAFSTILTIGIGQAHMDLSAGYSNDGRLHILYGRINVSTYYIEYIYSDDNGVNWSIPLDISALVPGGYPIFTPFGHLIENAGILMGTFYCVDAPVGIMTVSRIYNLRFIMGAWTAVMVTDDFYENESSIVSLGGNNLLLLARWETSPYARFMQYFSSDNGITWIKHGRVDFQLVSATQAKQAVLKKFEDNGEDIIVAYFPQLYVSDRPLYVCYARQTDLITYGTLGWNMNNVKEILNYPTITVYYGDICHYDNDYNAIGAYIAFDDALHHTGIIRFNIDTTDHDTRIALWQDSTFTTEDAELWTLLKANIANVAQWVDYRDKTKIIKNISNIVSRWDCRLGTGNDFTIGSNLLTATGMSFDGITQYKQTAAIVSLIQPIFIYIVFKQIQWRTWNHILSGLTDWTFALLQKSGDVTPEIRAYLSGGKYTGKSNELILNTYGIVRFAANGVDSFICVNLGSEKKQDNGIGNAGGIVLGRDFSGSYPANIEVKEMVTLKYVPDAAEQTYTMTRLAAKNGIIL